MERTLNRAFGALRRDIELGKVKVEWRHRVATGRSRLTWWSRSWSRRPIQHDSNMAHALSCYSAAQGATHLEVVSEVAPRYF